MLWSGEVVEEYVNPPQRDPADTEALRASSRRLMSDPRLFTTILPVGDGLSVSVRLPSTETSGARA